MKLQEWQYFCQLKREMMPVDLEFVKLSSVQSVSQAGRGITSILASYLGQKKSSIALG